MNGSLKLVLWALLAYGLYHAAKIGYSIYQKKKFKGDKNNEL